MTDYESKLSFKTDFDDVERGIQLLARLETSMRSVGNEATIAASKLSQVLPGGAAPGVGVLSAPPSAIGGVAQPVMATQVAGGTGDIARDVVQAETGGLAGRPGFLQRMRGTMAGPRAMGGQLLRAAGLPAALTAGGLLGAGLMGAVTLRAQEARAGARFGQGTADIDELTSALTNLGQTRATALRTLQDIGRASGETGRQLQLSTLYATTFSRAFGIDVGAIAAMGPVARAAGPGISTADVVARMAANIGGAQAAPIYESAFGAARGLAMTAAARGIAPGLGNISALQAGIAGGPGVIQGPFAPGMEANTRMIRAMDQYISSMGPLAIAANPMTRGESYVDWRKRLEAGVSGIAGRENVANILTYTRSVTGNQDEATMLLASQLGISFNQASRLAGLKPSDITQMPDADFKAITERAGTATTPEARAMAQASESLTKVGDTMLDAVGRFGEATGIFEKAALVLAVAAGASLVGGVAGLVGRGLITRGGLATAGRFAGKAGLIGLAGGVGYGIGTGLDELINLGLESAFGEESRAAKGYRTARENRESEERTREYEEGSNDTLDALNRLLDETTRGNDISTESQQVQRESQPTGVMTQRQ